MDNCYNAFCYADGILLCSTTITGLQNLINISVDYVVKFGLRFNPIKTACIRGVSRIFERGGPISLGSLKKGHQILQGGGPMV